MRKYELGVKPIRSIALQTHDSPGSNLRPHRL